MRYVLNVLVAFDQFWNAMIGGDPDETISSRAAKGMQEGRPAWCLLCRLLDLLQKDHCLKSLEPDEGSMAVLPD